MRMPTPTGRRASSTSSVTCFTIRIAGGDAIQLTWGMAFDAQPRFSPDGSRTVYTSDAERRAERLGHGQRRLRPVQISKGASNRAESPEWMPDGDYVVAAMGAFRFSGLPRLKLFHVDGGSGVQLKGPFENQRVFHLSMAWASSRLSAST